MEYVMPSLMQSSVEKARASETFQTFLPARKVFDSDFLSCISSVNAVKRECHCFLLLSLQVTAH
jgi:hypothetical protein